MTAEQIVTLITTNTYYINRRAAHIKFGAASPALAARYIVEDVVDDKIGSFEDHTTLVDEALSLLIK